MSKATSAVEEECCIANSLRGEVLAEATQTS
jgi:hypothetical protein